MVNNVPDIDPENPQEVEELRQFLEKAKPIVEEFFHTVKNNPEYRYDAIVKSINETIATKNGSDIPQNLLDRLDNLHEKEKQLLRNILYLGNSYKTVRNDYDKMVSLTFLNHSAMSKLLNSFSELMGIST